MERSGVTLITFMCFLFSRISGAEVEMIVRPGDDVTLYCDYSWEAGFNEVWFRNSSNKHQPRLIIAEQDLKMTFPRYSFVQNPSIKTHDLLVKNVTESDVGLYYCGGHEKKKTDRRTDAGFVFEDVYHHGNRITRLSLFDRTVYCADLQATPTPPVSDCSVCWKLLVSVCPVCVLLSSFLSSTCVYCIYRDRNKVEKDNNQGDIEKKQSWKSRKSDEVGEDGVCYASLDHQNRGQTRLKKKRVESSDFSTYSEVKTDQM